MRHMKHFLLVCCLCMPVAVHSAPPTVTVHYSTDDDSGSAAVYTVKAEDAYRSKIAERMRSSEERLSLLEQRLKEIEQKIVTALSYAQESRNKELADRLLEQEADLESQRRLIDALTARVGELETARQ